MSFRNWPKSRTDFRLAPGLGEIFMYTYLGAYTEYYIFFHAEVTRLAKPVARNESNSNLKVPLFAISSHSFNKLRTVYTNTSEQVKVEDMLVYTACFTRFHTSSR